VQRVPAAFQRDKSDRHFCRRQGLAVRDREHGIGRAVDHQQRHGDRAGRERGLRHQHVVGEARGVRRPREVARHEGARLLLVEGAVAGQRAGLADDVFGGGRAVRPVDVRACRGVAQVRRVGTGQVGRPADRRRADHREGDDELGVSEREVLRERAARGEAHDVRAHPPVRLEHGGRVADEVIAAIARPARRIGRGAARVALVVSHHEATRRREPHAEPLGPPEHRGHLAHDQQHGRVVRRAERFGAEPGVAGGDHGLGHATGACQTPPPLRRLA
jgi:hypothetical protein